MASKYLNMDGMVLNVVVAIAVVIISYFVLRTVTDPLRSIPGPLMARFTSLWLIQLDSSGHRTRTLHALHKRYGPVIRVGPAQLSFSTRAAMRDIYGPNSAYTKAPAYGAFGRKSLFTMRDRQEHRARQKRVAHIFGPASVALVEPLIAEHIGKFLRAMGDRVGQSLDVMLWFRMMALDITSDIFFGKNFGCLEHGKAPQILLDLDEVFPAYWVEWQFPFLHKLLMIIPNKGLHKFLTAGHRFYGYGAKAFEDYVSRYGRSGDRRDLLQKMIAAGKASATAEPLPDQDIIVEITNLIFAGVDTTAITLSFMFWELANHPEWQRRLQDELADVDIDCVPEHRLVASLPVLDAVLSETFRFWPAAPASLPRVVPKGGGTIDGVEVPQDIIVSCQSYSTHRDPSIFSNPDEFQPSRWLDASNDELTAMRDMILVWGKGQRICMGKAIATMELKMVIAGLMKRYTVELEREETNADMDMRDHFVLMAKGGKCMLRFKERSG